MGKVYTVKELSDGDIPSLDSHDKTLLFLENRMKSSLGVSFACLYGTAALGQTTVRSSLQIFVIMNDEEEGMKFTESIVCHVFHKFKVRVQVTAFTQEEWESRRISWGYGEMEHIRSCIDKNKFIYGNKDVLTDSFVLGSPAEYSKAFGFIAKAITELRKRHFSYGVGSEEEQCKFFERCLELPIQAVREYLTEKKLLSKGQSPANGEESNIDTWPKKSLVSDLTYDCPKTAKLFQKCIDNSKGYTDIVERYVSGKKDLNQYVPQRTLLTKESSRDTLSLLDQLAKRLMMSEDEIAEEKDQRSQAA